MRGVFCFAVLSALLAGSPALAGGDSPSAVTKAFYDAYLKAKVSGIPDAKARAPFTPLISSKLDKLLADADAAEQLHFRLTKNEEPPLVEGDPFSSLFEGATSYKLGACTEKAAAATCPVELTYVGNAGDKPVLWTDTAMLVKQGDDWVLDDIVFGATWDFGNKGHMQDLLAEVAKYSKEQTAP
jgi:hypothetical protein